MSRRLGSIVLASLLVLSSLALAGFTAGSFAATSSGAGTLVPAGLSGESVAAALPSPPVPSGLPSGSTGAAPRYCSSLETVANSPGYATFVRHIHAIAHGAVAAGLPAADLHLPYAGPIPDQNVNGLAASGAQLGRACDATGPTPPQTDPTGVAYDGQSDVGGLRDVTLESNSVAGILRVASQPENFYPGSGTPTAWGVQENVVLPNVTIFGQKCPTTPCASDGAGNYAFWVQNVMSYDSHNDTLCFVDDTWNFTSYTSEMFSSSLVDWSPLGGNYTGTWVAFSPYYHVPPPFTVTMYVNTSVDGAGDQILWYNYSIATPTHFIGNGNYDYLVFHSQPRSGRHLALAPPDFEASATSAHIVTDGYEFDAFIGADDGSNQLMLAADATMKVQYCDRAPYCTPTRFSYANVPAAVNYGSQTGEQTIGIAVNYVGSTAYLSAGPLILHGLWNFTGQRGVAPGATKVVNAITVSGDPEGLLATQPYVFVFLESTAFRSQGFQWAPDDPAWYLMPGTYRFEVMLSDYQERSGTITVGSSTTAILATLPYDRAMGVYTPLWAFGNGELAGISASGDGTIAHPYVPFNNPASRSTGSRFENLSPEFLSADDYDYPSFTGVFVQQTSAYVDLNAPPVFCVGATGECLGLEFFETSHLTLSHDALVLGWNAWSEISFYFSVPASQNPVPEAEVFVWNSTDDLILSNDFVATVPNPYAVAPDALVLYGGTDNVVWGNTFEDPPGVAPSDAGTYAGLGLGEGGDLIYNNNFSVDNPVVYLPYNWPNVADCLPQSLGGCAYDQGDNGWYYNTVANVVGETWNVTPQPASNVVHVVNGFPLSGNVLGPRVATQGGNYYWNYGTSPNNLSTRPYVDRFFYSDWSLVYPLGCGSIQLPNGPCGTPPPVLGEYEDGIAVGGDDAPYGPTAIFTESGLPAGTPWHVSVDGQHYGSTESTIVVPVAYGTFNFTAWSDHWQAHPHTGTGAADGIVSVGILFTPPPHGPLENPISPGPAAPALGRADP